MLVLFETPGGYAIFKLLDEKKLNKTDDLYKDFESPEKASRILKLKHFEKFLDTTEALASTVAAVEGKISKTLKKAIKKSIKGSEEEVMAVCDMKLGSSLNQKFGLSVLHNNSVQELMRCIRGQTESLLTGVPQRELTAMTLGLAHSLSRYKLKFSPDKVDTMIVQAISILDELDKILNNYIMRCREWYGWHYPELGKLISDNISYVKVVRLIGSRENIATSDLSDILPEDLEEKVKEAAEVSMGTEVSQEDILNILTLCDQILEMTQYRAEVFDYIRSRMMAIAPNMTILLGEIIGARLIAHSGSLINLAKQPASTVQIYGAEKALFRALKTLKDTPKYGLIYHANLVTGASNKNKGKISRTLAAKVSLVARVDAFGEDGEVSSELGIQTRSKVELRLKGLEEGNLRKLSGTAKAKAKFEKYHAKSEFQGYLTKSDSTLGKRKHDRNVEDVKPLIEEISSTPTQGSPPKKKVKKEKLDPEIDIKEEEDDNVGDVSLGSEKKKKKKKKIKEESLEQEMITEHEEAPPSSDKKKKKKKKVSTELNF